MRTTLRVLPVVAVAVLLAACSGGVDPEDADAPTTAAACDAGALPTLTDGELTVGTGDPYEPWYVGEDQTTGEGFESALVYAVADQLGYEADDVSWERVTFEQIIAPSVKPFDLAAYQTAITPERAQGVDFSSPYLQTAQGVVVSDDGDLADASALADFAGARVGVTATQTSRVVAESAWGDTVESVPFDDAGLAMQALSNGQVDAVVMDRYQAVAASTVYFPGTALVGTLPSGDLTEELGFVLDLDSPLTACVSDAVDALAADGTIDALRTEWLGGDDVPELG